MTSQRCTEKNERNFLLTYNQHNSHLDRKIRNVTQTQLAPYGTPPLTEHLAPSTFLQHHPQPRAITLALLPTAIVGNAGVPARAFGVGWISKTVRAELNLGTVPLVIGMYAVIAGITDDTSLAW